MDAGSEKDGFMNKTLPIVLWLIVLLVGGVVGYLAISNRQVDQNGVVMVDQDGHPVSSSQPGVAYADVKWEHLQSIPRFQFTNQDGEEFDTADINGRPMLVSFFLPNVQRFVVN